jgi:D-alanyl-D-alanine carboxypeptidase
MSLSIQRLILAGVLLICTLPVHGDLTSDLSGVVNTYMSQDNIPGVMVGVWQGNTQLAFVADGYSDLQTMTPISEDDEFKIGSVTKSMTVTRILQLAESGSINLDDPISDYVPGVENGSATLRQLANMTSGIYNYSMDGTFQAALGMNPEQTWTDNQLVGFANTHAPVYAPGTGPWNYSNTNTVLLGMVIEKVTGNSLQQELTNNIFTPLGMTHTVYPDPSVSSLLAPYLHGYDGEGDDVSSKYSSSLFSGAGAVFSTIDDLHLWGEALGQGTLLTANMQAQRLQFVDAGQGAPYYDSYGLGIGSIDGWIGHTGEQPGYSDLVLYDPSTDRTIVIVDNLSTGGENYPTDMFLAMQGILAVPEPSTYAMLALGVGALIFASRQRPTA